MSALRRILLRRRSPRLLFAAVFCALVLNGVAYLTHRHSDDEYRGSSGHTELCGYCATFGSLGGAPAVPAASPLSLSLPLLVLTFLVTAPILRRPVTSARPRAPPRS